MRKVAAIDIGTNSVRLLLAEWDGKKLTSLEKSLITTRLGEGTADSDRLLEVPMTRTVRAVEELAEKADVLGFELMGAYATSAVREASNRADFELMCEKAIGFRIEVLSGREESLAAFRGASDPKMEFEIIADIGGGSTELSFGRHGALEYADSVRVGAVRMKERFATEDGTLEASAKDELYACALREISTLVKTPTDGGAATGVSGTFTTFAAMKLELSTYDPRRIQDTILTRDEIQAFTDALSIIPYRERLKYKGLTPARADIIPSAGVIALAVMDAIKAKTIRVSDRDGLEGYLERKCEGIC